MLHTAIMLSLLSKSTCLILLRGEEYKSTHLPEQLSRIYLISFKTEQLKHVNNINVGKLAGNLVQLAYLQHWDIVQLRKYQLPCQWLHFDLEHAHNITTVTCNVAFS